MKTIKVMANGLPGNMAKNIARHILTDGRFELIPHSLTGPEITATEVMIGERKIALIPPDQRISAIALIRYAHGEFISLDFTQPTAVNANAEFYCAWRLPFVMGTTGGDRQKLNQTVEASSIPAVIAVNMAKQVVGFQAMMEYAGANFPNLFAGFSIKVEESHQKSKKDPSGTAISMIPAFTSLGVPFSPEQIIMERDPEIQKNKLGVAEAYLAGHGWHTYTLVSPDGTVEIGFKHKINGRDPYVDGALDSAVYLDRKVSQGAKGRVFSMIDVLKG